MGLASACPFCSCLGVRAINDPAVEMVGFRCHDCQRVFLRWHLEDVQARGEERGGRGRGLAPVTAA